MQPDNEYFTKEEKAVYSLRSLFERFGYKRYKMSRFEEYELYSQNKSFLENENVLTFTDFNGKLMALKPDVTLSNVKNTLASENKCVKLHYNEDVYRADNSSHDIKTIMQVGVENIGHIDLYSTAETLFLAKKSLGLIDDDNILDVSHLGFVSGLLKNIKEPVRAQLLHYIGEKNAHDIARVCGENGVDKEIAIKIAELASLYGPFKSTLEKARALIINDEMQSAADEMSAVYSVLENEGMGENINLDFSIVNDMNYYNGVIFQGYLQKIPKYVLSGGRYDRLLEKMGGNEAQGLSAIGFAVYLDLVDLYSQSTSDTDVDVAVLYDDKTDVNLLLKMVNSYAKSGRSAAALTRADKITASETVDLRGEK